MTEGIHPVAVVATGGGARGAYEAGALSVLLPALVQAGARPSVFIGTSAGSINAVVLASLAHRFDTVDRTRAAMDDLLRIWTSVTCRDVFRPVLLSAPGTLAAYLAEVTRMPWPRLTGVLDTSPLTATSERWIDWRQLTDNVSDGCVRAVGVTATTSHGWTRVFLDRPAHVGVPKADPARGLDYCTTRLMPEHLRASCAIPALFPAVRVSAPASASGWYLDGGVRLNAPLKPALDVGARSVVVVASHSHRHAPTAPADERPPPEIDDVLGQVLDSLLGDRLIEDLSTLARVNFLLAPGARSSPPEGRRPYRSIPYIAVAPEARPTLGTLAGNEYRRTFSGVSGWGRGLRTPDLPLLRRVLGGGDGERGGDLLSYLFFDAAFTCAAVRLGRQDAERCLRVGATADGMTVAEARTGPGTGSGTDPAATLRGDAEGTALTAGALPWRLVAGTT